MGSSIAIVGMACEYPDASSPAELFENVVAGRRAFRRIPDERLALDQYGEIQGGDAAANVDRTYVTEAALIEGYEFDRVRFKIVGSTYRSADLTHWLALDVADRALCDAGFEDGSGLPRERTGVVSKFCLKTTWIGIRSKGLRTSRSTESYLLESQSLNTTSVCSLT